MATNAACGQFSVVRGKKLRATNVDPCGLPLEGCTGQLVTDGFVTFAIARVQKDAEDIEQANADGQLCVVDRTPPELKWYEVTITLCNVDIALLTMLTGNAIVTDFAGKPVGYRSRKKVKVNKAVALELWTGTGATDCAVPTSDDVFTLPPSAVQYGYMLLPVLKEAVIGDIEIGASAATFTITGITAAGKRWGKGPYAVVPQDALLTPGRLLDPIGTILDDDGEPDDGQMHTEFTVIAPPAVTCGATDLILPSPYFGEGAANEVQFVKVAGATGGTFTLTHEATPTTPLDFDATAAEVQAALEALVSIGAGNVSVTAYNCTGYTLYKITFIGTLAGTDETQITATSTLTPATATIETGTAHQGG